MAWEYLAADWGIIKRISPGGQRGFLACFVCMATLVLASMVRRQADDEIIHEIEQERETARSAVLREFAWLLPALAVGVGLFLCLRNTGTAASDWLPRLESALGSETRAMALGAAIHALAAAVFGAALGWAVRILGTLGLGKEAFGTGDIYIMAAIGAVAGFWVVVFAFFLSAILALIGVVAMLFRKTSRAVPFGPWLALGTLAAIWMQPYLLDLFGPAGRMFWSFLCGDATWYPGA
jgi:hypothetical protein